MGIVKRMWEKGIYMIEEKYVCGNCFNDYEIKDFISMNASETHCDYCGERSDDGLIGAQLYEVIDFILEGIHTEWDDPNEEFPVEGGELVEVADIFTTEDMFMEIDLEIENEDLYRDLVNSFHNLYWCKKHPYSLSDQDRWFYTWKDFSEYVKHRNRYLFFRQHEEQRQYDSYYENDFDENIDENQLYQILNLLGAFVNQFEDELIKEIEIDTSFYRARINKFCETFFSYKELGPPPIEKAKYSNRMSPAGIPMFYGSYEEETAIAEVKNYSTRQVTVAEFVTLKKFKVLDLTSIKNMEIPSLFDEGRRFLRSPIIFLKTFLRDFSKKIEKDGKEHIEYVPTQVVTEYFRYVYRTRNDILKGIIYPSSQDEGGRSCVLFFQQDDCSKDDLEDEREDKWLEMRISSARKVLLKKFLIF